MDHGRGSHPAGGSSDPERDLIQPQCDFCGEDNPRWGYECEVFTIDIPDAPFFANTGSWAACGACAIYIDEQLWGPLLDRVLDMMMGLPDSRLAIHYGYREEDLREHYKGFASVLHEGFRIHQKGPRMPISELVI